jgi:hypothetical protein
MNSSRLKQPGWSDCDHTPGFGREKRWISVFFYPQQDLCCWIGGHLIEP